MQDAFMMPFIQILNITTWRNIEDFDYEDFKNTAYFQLVARSNGTNEYIYFRSCTLEDFRGN